MDKNTGENPAFAAACENVLGGCEWQSGITQRAYAAIHLKVPDSGEKWLDEMIRKANRRDAACAAMQGVLSNPLTMEKFSEAKSKIDGIPKDEYIIHGCYAWSYEFLKQYDK